MKFSLSVLAVVFCFTACKNKPGASKSEDAGSNAFFYDYQVWGDEEEGIVTVRLQYRLGGENGKALRLAQPGFVMLDGDTLKADSAGFTGIFYETSKPLGSFAGSHGIVFTDNRKKQHKEEFSFEPFTLENELPEQIKKAPFLIKLSGFPSTASRVQLIMVDTSFSSADVNEELWVENGEIKIDSSFLANLSNGPITMEIVKEDEKTLKNSSREDGRLLLTYRLRRQFEFVD